MGRLIESMFSIHFDNYYYSGLFLIGILLLDQIFGDPQYRLHPIRLMGDSLNALEVILRKMGLNGYIGGVILFLLLTGIWLGITFGVAKLLQQLNSWLPVLWLLFVGYSFTAVKDLCVHGKRVAEASQADDLTLARKRVSFLVGRDVSQMDSRGCNRAAIESLSENLTDGILSPLFWYLIAGLPGIIVFKVVSTMDSMVGYKNERYIRFGWCGARVDDVMNWIPARLSWILITTAAWLMPWGNAKSAFQIGKSQARVIPSPNSGWSEATAAGALQIKLVGPIWYNGKVATTVWVGDESHREGATPEDITRMIKLIYLTTTIFVAIGLIIRWSIGWV